MRLTLRLRIFLTLVPLLGLLGLLGGAGVVLLYRLGGSIDLILKENYASVVAMGMVGTVLAAGIVGGLSGSLPGVLLGAMSGVLLIAFGSVLGGTVLAVTLTIFVCGLLGGWLQWISGRESQPGSVSQSTWAELDQQTSDEDQCQPQPG